MSSSEVKYAEIAPETVQIVSNLEVSSSIFVTDFSCANKIPVQQINRITYNVVLFIANHLKKGRYLKYTNLSTKPLYLL
ncbi:MAG: hypothetical protein ACI9SJ_000743 [Flavobacteriaceae bacterium]|jgi:hypothetical protein